MQTLKTDASPKNDCNFTFRLPNLMNDISNKTDISTESKEINKLWSKAMSGLKLFIDTFILGHPVMWRISKNFKENWKELDQPDD